MGQYFLKFFRDFLIPLGNKISSDELFTRSAAVAYSASLAFAPTIILIVSFLGLLRLNIIHFLAIQTNRLMGYEVGEVVLKLADYSKNNIQFASLSGLLGLLILLMSGSLFFRQVEQTMTHIFKDFVKPQTLRKNSYYATASAALRKKFFSILIFVFGITFVIVSLCVSFFMSNTLGHYSPPLYALAYELLSFFLFALLFFMIYLSTPAIAIQRRIVFLGSLITALLFLIGKELIAIYISSAGVTSIYGATGSIVVFLIWFYYSSLTVFVGAEIISVVAKPLLKSK